MGNVVIPISMPDLYDRNMLAKYKDVAYQDTVRDIVESMNSGVYEKKWAQLNVAGASKYIFTCVTKTDPCYMIVMGINKNQTLKNINEITGEYVNGLKINHIRSYNPHFVWTITAGPCDSSGVPCDMIALANPWYMDLSKLYFLITEYAYQSRDLWTYMFVERLDTQAIVYIFLQLYMIAWSLNNDTVLRHHGDFHPGNLLIQTLGAEEGASSDAYLVYFTDSRSREPCLFLPMTSPVLVRCIDYGRTDGSYAQDDTLRRIPLDVKTFDSVSNGEQFLQKYILNRGLHAKADLAYLELFIARRTDTVDRRPSMARLSALIKTVLTGSFDTDEIQVGSPLYQAAQKLWDAEAPASVMPLYWWFTLADVQQWSPEQLARSTFYAVPMSDPKWPLPKGQPALGANGIVTLSEIEYYIYERKNSYGVAPPEKAYSSSSSSSSRPERKEPDDDFKLPPSPPPPPRRLPLPKRKLDLSAIREQLDRPMPKGFEDYKMPPSSPSPSSPLPYKRKFDLEESYESSDIVKDDKSWFQSLFGRK